MPRSISRPEVGSGTAVQAPAAWVAVACEPNARFFAPVDEVNDTLFVAPSFTR